MVLTPEKSKDRIERVREITGHYQYVQDPENGAWSFVPEDLGKSLEIIPFNLARISHELFDLNLNIKNCLEVD